MLKIQRAKLYLKFAQLMISDTLIYRADIISRYISWATRFLISAYLWIALTASKGGEIAGYTLQESLTYFLLMQIVTGFVFSGAGFQISSDIQSGELSNKLVLPVSYPLAVMFLELGKTVFFFFSHIIIYLGIGLFFSKHFDLSFDPLFILWGVTSMVIAFLLNFCFLGIIGMLAFWISTSQRLIYTFFAIITLASGILVPLEFFPESIREVLFWSPFPYLFYFPVHIMQSDFISAELTRGFGIQMGYTIVMFTLLYLVYNRGLKTYEAVGK